MRVTSVSSGCYGRGPSATAPHAWPNSCGRTTARSGCSGWPATWSWPMTLPAGPVSSLWSVRAPRAYRCPDQQVAPDGVREGLDEPYGSHQGQHHLHLWLHFKNGFYKEGKKDISNNASTIYEMGFLITPYPSLGAIEVIVTNVSMFI